MTVTIGINGFGRIGRCTLAHIAESARNDVQVVKINATGPIATNAHLLKYDSVHGRFGSPITVDGSTMDLGRGPIDVMSTYNPEELDWSGCDVVLEKGPNLCTRKKREPHSRLRRKPPRHAGVRADDLKRVMHHKLSCAAC
jgi:glyceraldehyde 3-phosphate dehydrogenase